MKLNKKLFLNITTKEIAYLYGFIWADGHIVIRENKYDYRVMIKIAKGDGKEIKDILLKTGDWCISYPNNGGTIQFQASKNDKEIVNFLKDNDYLIKSGASPDKILSKIPEHLKHYWWRGYFDGDGYVCKSWWNIDIASAIEQNWLFAKKMCKELDITFRSKKNISKCGNSSHFYLVSRYDCIKFLTYIYKDFSKDKMGLKRKYNTFISNLDKINNSYKNGKGICIRGKKFSFVFRRKTIKTCNSLEDAIKVRKNFFMKENLKQFISYYPLEAQTLGMLPKV